jgi:molybdopterin-guanine dinucleotide biosynthesis adapter protein
MKTHVDGVPVLGFAAYSGTGKTTLLRKLLPLLTREGLRVAVIKHAHHDFDTDVPGKDSYELRRAGAAQMIVASRRRRAFITETPEDRDPSLAELLDEIDARHTELVLVEGFKAEPVRKIELHRPSLGYPLLCLADPTIVALATDAPLALARAIPQLDLNRPEDIVDFILRTIVAAPSRAAAAATEHSLPR